MFAIISMPRHGGYIKTEFIGTLGEVRDKLADGYLNDIYGAKVRQTPDDNGGFITRTHVIDVVELDEATLEFAKPYRYTALRWLFYRFYPFLLALWVMFLSLTAFLLISFIPALLLGKAEQYINEITDIFTNK